MKTESERAERLRQAIRQRKAAARSRTPDLPARPGDEPARLGELQQSLWLAHRMDPISPAYHLASAFRVEGALDVGGLAQAVRGIARHRLLRSTFRVEGDTVRHVIHPQPLLSLEVREVGEGKALAAALAEAREPFDLEAGPLVRVRLIEETPRGERFLLLVLHHILADERSLEVLWQEISEAYRGGGAAGTGAEIQYDDYAAWARGQAAREREAALDFWRRRLEPLPEDLRLPFERPPAEAGAPRGRLLVRPSSESTRRGLRRLAAATGTTPFAVGAFAFRLLLQRYTEGARVAFATPVSMRSHPATAKMVGYFLNAVVISNGVDEAHPVEDAVRDFSAQLRGAMAHASLPFHELAEALSPPRHPDRHPIFQAMFVYKETSPPPELGAARLEPVTLDLGAAKFDVTVFLDEKESSLELAVEYRADRFDDIWMEKLRDHYHTLLERLPEDLARPTADVSMLSKRELGALRDHARGISLDTSSIALLPRQILEAARRSPEAPAVVCGPVRRSYRELTTAAAALARELAKRGVQRGDRVGLCVDRSFEMLAGLLGAQWAGAAYVPLDPAYPEARNRGILEDAEVTAVLTTSSLRGRLPDGAWAVVEVGGAVVDGGGSAAELPELTRDDPAYVLYTSGSTGRPKGVVVSHANLRASTAARLAVYDLPPKRFLLVPSVAFDSSVAGLFWTLAAGGTLVIPTDEEARDPRRLAELVAEHRVTSLLIVPSLYARMLAAGGEELAGLESAIVAGESCSSRLVEEHFRALPRVRLFNEYGPTEATVWATVHELTERDAERPVAIGRPIPGVRVDVLDALGRPVPAGIPGQAFITGPTVADGYWRRPELTEERFVFDAGPGRDERRYRTGDRVVRALDGRLVFLGREDDQIKLRGFRIEPGEIEAALHGASGIERAAVVARQSGSGGETLVAFVETTGGDAPEGWRPELAKHLPDYMIPARLVTLAELPRLPNGKLDRNRLRELPLEPETVDAPERAVPSTREQALISLWEGLLGRYGLGPTDNFFELGGHSLLVVELTLAIERDFEVALTAADVFESPTVRELSRRIDERGGRRSAPYEHLFPIQPRGSKAPFIAAVPHFFTEMLARRFRDERPVYGLRGVSLRPEGNRGRWRTLTALGEELVEEILRRFPNEEGYILAGYSFGASMAVEAVRILEERAVPVRRLFLIAPMPFDLYRIGPIRVQLDGLRKGVDELSHGEAFRLFLQSNHPLTRRPYRRAWRRLAIEPWRRLLCAVGRLRTLAGLPLTSPILQADVRVERFRLHARYRPGVVQTPTVIFNAREPETDAAATWRPYFGGPIEVYATPDPHLDEDSAEAARQEILRHLEDLDDA